MKQRYLIDYENAHWCGGQMNVVVWAENETEAEILAADYMEETQREQFSQEYGDSVCEDEEYEDESAVSINSIELFDEGHKEWEFFMNPTQRAAFYPIIGMPY
jgi:hypothetical protein